MSGSKGLTIGIDARAAAEEPAGRGRFVRELLLHLAGRDDPHRYVLFARERWEKELDSRFEWSLLRSGDPWWHVRAARAADRECEVFFSTNSYLTAWLLRIPVAVVVYDLVSFRPGAKANRKSALIERATIRRALGRARWIMCISHATRQDLSRLFPGSEEKSSVVQLGASPHFYERLSPASLKEVRSRFELGRNFVLSVGTVEPRKNVERVLEAYGSLDIALREEYDLVLVGPLGWDYDEVLARARAGGDRIRLLGHVDDETLAALYQSCAVFCYPSLYEGFGLPLLEALAAGAPAITSNVSSLPEVGGDAVIYVDPTSSIDLCQALDRLLRSEEERAALRKLARRRAQAFSWEVATHEILERLESIAQRYVASTSTRS